MAGADWGPFGLQGRVAVVTGAAAGIGRGVTDRFTQAGAVVLLVDQDDEGLANAVRSLKRGGAQVSGFEADITAPGAGEAVVEHCRQTLGEIDVLVNNAGIYPMIAMADLSPEAIDRILGLNLVAAMLMARAVATRMIDRNAGGAIINIASIDGVRPSSPGFLAYCASKGGLLAANRALAVELSPHRIRVNAISPGGVLTEGVRRGLAALPEEHQQAALETLTSHSPLGRMAEPDDVATAAVFLASPASSYITGANLVVDGGQLRGPS